VIWSAHAAPVARDRRSCRRRRGAGVARGLAVRGHLVPRPHPEIWRDGAGERGRIVAAQALALLTSALFILLAVELAQTGLAAASKLALAIWLIGPLPMLLANHMFIKIDPRVTASHAVGWLVKLLLIATATAFFVR